MLTNIPQIIFSDKASQIIPVLLKKYKLQQDRKKAIEVIKKGKKTNYVLLVNLTARKIKNNLTSTDLTNEIIKIFNLPRSQAKNLAKEVESKIIPLAEDNIPKFESAKISPPSIIENPKNKKSKNPDFYRESVE